MRSGPAGEAVGVEMPESPVEKAATARRAPAKRQSKGAAAPRPPTPKRRPASARAKIDPAPEPVQERSAGRPRRTLLAVRLGAAAIAVAAAVFVLVGGDAEPTRLENGKPTTVSGDELSRFAGTHGTAVYWAGAGSRRLELTATPAGTFVRYLPADTNGADAGLALTVATYPLADAYATAARRSRSERMTSRRTADGGIAVWSLEQPTSVYLAWRGVPSLVEVYAPTAAEARRVALSGRVRPVR